MLFSVKNNVLNVQKNDVLFKFAINNDQCIDKLEKIIQSVSDLIFRSNLQRMQADIGLAHYNRLVKAYNQLPSTSDFLNTNTFNELKKTEAGIIADRNVSHLKLTEAEKKLKSAEDLINNKDHCPDPPQGMAQRISALKAKVTAAKNTEWNSIVTFRGATNILINDYKKQRQSRNPGFQFSLFPIPAPNGAALLEALGALLNFLNPFRGAH